jgi:hypothetical protein
MIAVAPRADGSFPYDNPVVGIAYTSLTIELANALDAIGTPYFRARAIDYLAARRTFKGLLKRDDFRHFETQCRQISNPALPAAFLVRQLLSASLRHDRESAVKILGAGEALLNDHAEWTSQAFSA